VALAEGSHVTRSIRSRARARQGFMKVLVDAESRKILGVGILGIGGDEC
jgi:pyruvate/2-oxoglutarate dehydrogenase complex dihydrolipoamide dehydrogenase (E3) component